MSNPFYAKGLQFECQQCSRCCRHEPGYVYLSENDLKRLSGFVEMEEDQFIELYCRNVNRGVGSLLSLKEKSNYDCIFWEHGRCKVYPARPFQCRSFPFWNTYLSTEEAWNNLAKTCPGINRGTLHTFEEIEQWKKLRSLEVYLNIDKIKNRV